MSFKTGISDTADARSGLGAGLLVVLVYQLRIISFLVMPIQASAKPLEFCDKEKENR